MAVSEEQTFASWAIMELMGHRRLAGKVTVQELAGARFFRIDIPSRATKKEDQVENPPEFISTQFFGPAAIYCLTPTTEEIARAVAVESNPAPINQWELRRLMPPPPVPAPADQTTVPGQSRDPLFELDEEDEDADSDEDFDEAATRGMTPF